MATINFLHPKKMEDLISKIQNKFIEKKDFPIFKSGDTITVFYEIREGEKVRIQFLKALSYRLRDTDYLKHLL